MGFGNGYHSIIYFGTDKPLTKLKFGVEDIFYGSNAEELIKEFMERQYKIHVDFAKVEGIAALKYNDWFYKNQYFQFNIVGQEDLKKNYINESNHLINVAKIIHSEYVYEVDMLVDFWYDREHVFGKDYTLLCKRQFEWFLQFMKSWIIDKSTIKFVYLSEMWPHSRDLIESVKVNINDKDLVGNNNLTDDNREVLNSNVACVKRHAAWLKEFRQKGKLVLNKKKYPYIIYEFYVG